MNKLILDPGLFEISENLNRNEQMEHFYYLAETIDFIGDFVDGAIDSYNGAPYSYYLEEQEDREEYHEPPITRSLIIKNKYVNIKKKLLRFLKEGQMIDLGESAIFDCSMQFESNSITTNAFKKYLYYLLIQTSSCSPFLLLLSKVNEHLAPTVRVFFDNTTKTIPSISNPASDCNQIIGPFLKSCSDENDLFPQKSACHQLNDCFLYQTHGLELSQRKAICIKYGRETASRNGYKQNPTLSKKNAQYIVYVHENGQYFLSIDLEHGGLEMFARQGTHAQHLGEYDYSGGFSKEAQPQTHRLIL